MSGEAVPAPDAFARLVIAALERSGMAERTTVQSFDWRTLIAIKGLRPRQATACLTIESESMNTNLVDGTGASPWHAGLRAAEHGSVPRLAKAAGARSGRLTLMDADLEQQVVAASRRWIETAVIGLNLCPFARAVMTLAHSLPRQPRARRAGFARGSGEELRLLAQGAATNVETTLLIHPGRWSTSSSTTTSFRSRKRRWQNSFGR